VPTIPISLLGIEIGTDMELTYYTGPFNPSGEDLTVKKHEKNRWCELLYIRG